MSKIDENILGIGNKNRNNLKKQRQSHKGYYKLGFVEPFTGMTERDLEIRQEYSKDLISKFCGVPKDMVYFRKKSSKQTIVSLDEVFYVKIGKETVGKLSIRIQRMFKTNNMTIIYQEKKLRDGSTYSRDAQGSFKKKTKSSARKNNRNNKRKKSNKRL